MLPKKSSEMSDCYREGRNDQERLNIVDTITVFKYRDNIVVSNPTQEEHGIGRATAAFVLDDDNDFVLPRRNVTENILRIEHSTYTDINSVGLQIWNGAILLANFIIFESHKFKEKHVLELGSGTGFVSIIAAKYCASITCTDLNDNIILKTIERNFCYNRSSIRAVYRVLPFNFSEEWSSAIREVVKEADVILASELIYDNGITDSLIKTLIKILEIRPNISIYLSVEKRYVFTRANQMVEATHYEYFLNLLKRSLQVPQFREYELSQIIDVPQYFYEYEQCKEIELWHVFKSTR